jgi:hypothetical protein
VGAGDFTSVWGWFTPGALASGSASTCLVYYAPSTNRIYLENNAATAWQSTPMGSGSLSNSQCTVNAAGASVTAAGNTLTLNVPITFTSGFAGVKNTYMYAAGGTLSSGWYNMGSWTVQ